MTAMSNLLDRLSKAASFLRRVIGAPDYERYVAHVRARHPEQEPIGAAEFYRTRLEERYNRPGAKCC